MHFIAHRLALLMTILASASASAGASGAQPQPPVSVHRSYVMQLDRWGNAEYQTVELDENGRTISGTIGGEPFVGTRDGDDYLLVATAPDQSRSLYRARASGGAWTGSADVPDSNRADRRAQHRFSARLVPERPAGGARTYHYAPTSYSNQFSSQRPPVMTIWPGDSVQTTTVDSGGVDEHGATVALYGNPQTGPFHVAGAEAGDVLAIHLTRLRLNRDYADSLDMLVHKAQTTRLAARAGELGRPIRWRLDLANGFASPDAAQGALRQLRVPLRPMLGGLAVAPGTGMPPISTGDSGAFGGNMDFNEVVEGNTVYLAVNQPGALLYLGDAHALQGDGETSQYALETSMAVEFRVELIKKRSLSLPRVESPTHIMTLGQAGSLDEALKSATSGLTQWLAEDYGLSLSESAQVLGAAVEYRVVNLAGRSVGLAAKLDKRLLQALRATPR
jgi:amidase